MANSRKPLTPFLVLLLALPASAGTKRVPYFGDPVESPCGSLSVADVSKAKRVLKVNLVPDQYRAVSSVMIAMPALVLEPETLVFRSTENGKAHVTVELYLLAGTDLREQLTPNEWRRKIKEFLIDASRSGTYLVLPDGAEFPASFGPDNDRVYFYANLGTVRTNEDGEIVFRNFVWQEKDEYLAKLTFQFEIDEARWKQEPGAQLKIGDIELEFQKKGTKRK